jgi:phosphoglycerate dehydrogenase-like enzyme
MKNAIATPHVSGHSSWTQARSLELTGENLCRYATGDPLLNVVDRGAGY